MGVKTLKFIPRADNEECRDACNAILRTPGLILLSLVRFASVNEQTRIGCPCFLMSLSYGCGRTSWDEAERNTNPTSLYLRCEAHKVQVSHRDSHGQIVLAVVYHLRLLLVVLTVMIF